jgi:hypothetical protein
MSIAQRLADYQAPRIGALCKTCSLLEELPESESVALQKALDDPTISNAGLSKILKAEGFSIADTTIRRHRVGECKK